MSLVFFSFGHESLRKLVVNEQTVKTPQQPVRVSGTASGNDTQEMTDVLDREIFITNFRLHRHFNQKGLKQFIAGDSANVTYISEGNKASSWSDSCLS